jgi:hypothetical protein
MNNIIQSLIGFRPPDIGYWNFLPRHFTSLLYLGEIYRTLTEVTLKKNVKCGSAVQSVQTVTSTQLTRTEMLYSSHISVAFTPHIGHFLHITECRHNSSRESSNKIFQTFFSSPFIVTFKPHSMPHELLQYVTTCRYRTKNQNIQQ